MGSPTTVVKLSAPWPPDLESGRNPNVSHPEFLSRRNHLPDRGFT